MKYFFCLILLSASFFLFSRSASGQENSSGFDYYKKLNDNETRLIQFKDDDLALRNKVGQLSIINLSRKRFNAQEVKLDILASRVANKQCREAAEHGYLSHWNLAGEKPYMRYAFAGGKDHISENAFAETNSEDYNTAVNVAADLMKAGHGSFMRERAPYDGHKQNVINKTHNYVGLGYYINGGQFRYDEEYIDRYIDFIYVPGDLEINESGTLTVDTKGKSFLFFITIYREDIPEPMSVSQLSETSSYGDFTDEVFANLAPWDLKKFRHENIYTIPLKFQKDGIYYLHIYLDDKEFSGYGSASTDGKDPVSGIVIRVKR
jgi:hypothetical protein